MVKRITASLVLLGVLCLGAPTQGQVADGPSPEQQQMMQQMQDMRAKIMDNMQKQGIDPQQFFQEMRQKMQDGTFDMNDFQQELVDKGLIDQDSVTTMQTSMQKLTMDGIKRQLGAADDEWAVLLPKIQAVITARAAYGQNGGGGMGGFMAFGGGAQGTSEVTKARRALHDAVKDASTPADVVSEKLAAYRGARAAAKTAFTGAEKELQDLLTPRQEGILVRLGLLD